ncbi:hypothetical protein ACW6QP_05005 [Salegentibacter sp. HM20]
MKLIHRIGYFSVGLFFGIVLLFFFLGGKKTSCDYSPNARVLKDIRLKDKNYSPEALAYFSQNNLDTAEVSSLLENGRVDFGKSNTKSKPCKTYFITNKLDSKTLELQIENCDSLATIQKVNLSQ